MINVKKEIIDGIIEVEDGYVDDPLDSGGETNYGITIAVARKYGYEGDMKDLSRDLAFQIYSDRYWDALKLDDVCELSPILARELADTGINMGVGRAAKFLQRSLNALNNGGSYYADIAVDGAVGGQTILALTSFLDLRGNEGKTILFNMLNCLQGEFYISLAERREKDEKFIYGWFKHRVTIKGNHAK